MTDAFDVPGVDALFDAELADFVGERDALVKQRKAEGDKEGAASVKALRKPSTVAWGINRVARSNPAEVDALFAAGAAVRAAQMEAVQGIGDGGLRDKAKTWRDQVNALAALVAKLIGDTYRDDAAASFEAASADEDLADVVRRGRLTNAIEAAGFGLAGMPDPPPRRAEPVPVTSEPEADAAGDAFALDQAREDLLQCEKKLEQALHRLRRAEQRLDQAREAVDDARLTYEETLIARDNAAREIARRTS